MTNFNDILLWRWIKFEIRYAAKNFLHVYRPDVKKKF